MFRSSPYFYHYVCIHGATTKWRVTAKNTRLCLQRISDMRESLTSDMPFPSDRAHSELHTSSLFSPRTSRFRKRAAIVSSRHIFLLGKGCVMSNEERESNDRENDKRPDWLTYKHARQALAQPRRDLMRFLPPSRPAPAGTKEP